MAQIRCGKMKAFKTGEVRFEGRITLEGRLDDVVQLKVHPRSQPDNERAPSFEIFLVKGGRAIACGSAWSKHHETVGDFVSMTLDNVRWPNPLNLTAFPPEKSGDDWSVVWSRPRAKRPQTESFAELADEDAN